MHVGGVVTRFEFINPHAVIYLETDRGEWWIECASPQALIRRGVSRSSLRAGMQIEIEGYQAKDGSPRMYGRELTLQGGRVLLLNPSAQRSDLELKGGALR